jgi:hypothetical protein
MNQECAALRENEHLNAVEYKPDWPKCDLTDFSRLRIEEGQIHFRLYRQDGTMQPMTVEDSPMNRLYVSWMQIHDRHTPRPPA